MEATDAKGSNTEYDSTQSDNVNEPHQVPQSDQALASRIFLASFLSHFSPSTALQNLRISLSEHRVSFALSEMSSSNTPETLIEDTMDMTDKAPNEPGLSCTMVLDFLQISRHLQEVVKNDMTDALETVAKHSNNQAARDANALCEEATLLFFKERGHIFWGNGNRYCSTRESMLGGTDKPLSHLFDKHL